MKLKLDAQALLWLGLGACVLALVAMKEPINQLVTTPLAVWNTSLLLGTGASLVGILLVLLLGLAALQGPTLFIVEGTLLRWRDLPTAVEFAKSVDLWKLRQRYAKEFGGDIPDLEMMHAWLGRYENCFTLLYQRRTDRDMGRHMTLLGSYKLLPITADAQLLLESGKVSGSTFKPEHICPEANAAAFYVGDLFASGVIRSGAVLSHLDSQCELLLRRGYVIYARPFTNRGRRVMIKRGFRHVSNGSYDLQLRQLCKLEAPTS